MSDIKSRVSLLPASAILEVGKVGALGALKHGEHDYRKGLSQSTHIDAAFRHLLNHNAGNRLDKEDDCEGCNKDKCTKHTGLSHLASAAWRLLAALEQELNGIGQDDLFKGYKTSEFPDNAGGS